MAQEAAPNLDRRLAAAATTYQGRAWLGRLYQGGGEDEPDTFFVAAPLVDEACWRATQDLRKLCPNTLIMTIAPGDIEDEAIALEAGADDYMSLPPQAVEVFHAVEMAALLCWWRRAAKGRPSHRKGRHDRPGGEPAR